ncbi:hypothetical protein N7492_004377 [Penicillium capsulatum]|uniref:CMP/dCMP-type deaminase domain-containing protein n=1 Tax=Penicillium capsulatum TaxID=69766 RepID=A0A9W9I9R6_9EURO|nr:hypothetical protein N7492_004377 [Penicillium capsulatum]
MGTPEIIHDLQPLRGRVTPIRTIQETQPVEEFGDAYVVEVNVKAASKVIKALDSAFSREASIPVSHLRRFCKQDALPESLREAIEAKRSPAMPPTQTIFVMIPPPLPPTDQLVRLLAPFVPGASSDSSAIAASSSAPAIPDIPFITTRIPIQPPFNLSQAERWTREMWPVVFNPAAPRSTVAPPHQVLGRAQDAIQPRAGHYLALSRKVAQEAKQLGRGRGVGAVIVDPAIEAEIESEAYETDTSNTARWMDAVIAVGEMPDTAGKPSQADLHPGAAPNPASSTYNADLESGPDLHALMRATELVACRRRSDPAHEVEMASRSVSTAPKHDPQLSTQLSPLESYFLGNPDCPTTTPASKPTLPPISPQKRKHESPNPESSSLPPVLNISSTSEPTPSQITEAPLPAPPPSTTALADPTIAQTQIQAPGPASTSITAGAPIRETTSRIRTRSEGGYLCTDLDIYLSHEPCLCCSMGMLLSRFRAVIFPRRGRMTTGGISSEPVVGPVAVETGEEGNQHRPDSSLDRLYYGLHWRKELNWRALGFEFVELDENGLECVSDHGILGSDVIFHA